MGVGWNKNFVGSTKDFVLVCAVVCASVFVCVRLSKRFVSCTRWFVCLLAESWDLMRCIVIVVLQNIDWSLSAAVGALSTSPPRWFSRVFYQQLLVIACTL